MSLLIDQDLAHPYIEKAQIKVKLQKIPPKPVLVTWNLPVHPWHEKKLKADEIVHPCTIHYPVYS